MQLISSNAPISTQMNQCTRYLKDHTTGIDTPWHLLVPRPSYMRMPTGEHHGQSPGLDAWLLGPSKDCYHCNLYYVPETCGYCVSGSANLFPQRCIAPAFTPVTHVQELADELQATLATMQYKRCTSAVLNTLAQQLNAYVSGTTPSLPKQRVEQKVKDQQMIHNGPTLIPPGIQRVSDAQPAPVANNPTSTRVLHKAARTHQRTTQSNTPGALPRIRRVNIIEPTPLVQSPPSLGKAKPPDKGTRFETQSTNKRYNTTKVQPISTTAIAIVQQTTNQPSSHQPSPSR